MKSEGVKEKTKNQRVGEFDLGKLMALARTFGSGTQKYWFNHTIYYDLKSMVWDLFPLGDSSSVRFARLTKRSDQTVRVEILEIKVVGDYRG